MKMVGDGGEADRSLLGLIPFEGDFAGSIELGEE
jgi:hypothetical protein